MPGWVKGMTGWDDPAFFGERWADDTAEQRYKKQEITFTASAR